MIQIIVSYESATFNGQHPHPLLGSHESIANASPGTPNYSALSGEIGRIVKILTNEDDGLLASGSEDVHRQVQRRIDDFERGNELSVEDQNDAEAGQQVVANSNAAKGEGGKGGKAEGSKGGKGSKEPRPESKRPVRMGKKKQA
jgi:hypothetical protein